MQFSLAVTVLCLSLVAAVEVTPTQKVIQLLKDMHSKGVAERQKEQVMFAAYKQFCDDITVQKRQEIADNNQKIESLNADIEKANADAADLGVQISEHEADVATWDGDVKAATKVRSIEKADYDKTHKDYTESVEALRMAIDVLKKQAYDRKQAAKGSSLAQIASLKNLNLIPDDAKKVIDMFLQGGKQEPAASARPQNKEAHGYEFQSQGVIDLLNNLLDKFIAERTSLEKEEVGRVQAYETLIQSLATEMGQAKTDISQKKQFKASKMQASADATGDLADTTSTRDDDEKYLTETTATCQQKATDYDARQQLRADELKALEEATGILESKFVTGHADTHLHKLESAAALAQLRSGGASPAQKRAAAYLQQKGMALQSRVLSSLAARVVSDPFAKVKSMIKELVVRLMEEATEEASHKGWCDQELGTNEQTRMAKTERVETLHAELDSLTASIAKAAEEVAMWTQEVANLDTAMAEQTTMRAEEKANNAKTIKESQEAQVAVAQALVVLKEFYSGAAKATAFTQQQPEAPEIFDSPYKGMAAESGGVVGMLEVIEADFARLESDTTAAETTSQKEYETFMENSKINKVQLQSDIEHRAAKKQKEVQSVADKKADLDGTQKELDAALDYFEKLKPSCLNTARSFEDRVARRKEEIESLQEALRILNGENLA